jgi:hypothetical protein
LNDEYPSQFIYVDEHAGGYFCNSFTLERAAWYGVYGVPVVYFSGKTEVEGAISCDHAYASYRAVFLEQLSANDGMSPVAIDGDFTIDGQVATLNATFLLVDPVDLSYVRAAFFLYEDQILYEGSYWDHIDRVIAYEPITTLHQVGDTATVVKTVDLSPSWDPAHLHAAVVLESAVDPKGILQASRLPSLDLADFSLSFPVRVSSVPQGSGTVTFTGSVWNLRPTPDQMTLAVDQSSGWPTDFQVEGDPAWYTSLVLPLGARESKAITVRVRTDGARRVGTVGLSATSAATGRRQPTSLRVFNASPAILFVDDDGGAGYQGVDFDVIFRTTLEQLGYLYEWWDVERDHGGVGPSISSTRGFDALIWQTAYTANHILLPCDAAVIQTFLEEGGAVYLNSMDFLSTLQGPTQLTYMLGVASWTNDTRAAQEHGVAGDPISDGLVLPLTWPVSPANRTDTVNPTASAIAILFSEDNEPNAVRNLVGSEGRVVFSTIPHNTYGTSAPDPNNARAVMGRIMGWLLPADISGVSGDRPLGAGTSLTASPNPFHPGTDLAFRISHAAAGAPARLTLVDVAGRAVRSLVEGRLAGGVHHAFWDGKDDSGNSVASGIYFARLVTGAGTVMTKVIRV